jgi:integron integrase
MHDAPIGRSPGTAPPPALRLPASSGGSREGGRIYVAVASDELHVRFGPGFSAGDLEIVKRIRGRRWDPETRTWRVPRSEVVLSSLRREFGDRLVEDDGGACGRADHVAAANAAPEGEDAGVAADPRNRVVEPGPAEGAGEVAASGLVAELRRVVRLREYSRMTEKAYVSWVERYFRWVTAVGAAPGTAAAGAMNEATLVAFLEHLGHEGLAARSRNQAASALNFLLREVLRRDDVELPRARGPVRMPVVLTHHEVMRLLDELKGKYLLIGMLLYSSGLRIGECVSLRIKDVDFELRQILVRDGKGRKDRYVPLAARAAGPLRAQVQRVHEQQRRDLAGGHGWAPLPGALHRKDPSAGYQPGWQFLFPASSINADPATGRTGRWPLHVSAAERAFKTAVRNSGIQKRATCHTLRHSYATETLRGGCDIRTLQQIMGHRDIRTTTIYLHVVQQTGFHIRSPLDRPDDYEDFGCDMLPALLPGEEGGRPAGRGQPGESGQTVENSTARRRRQPLA